MEALVGQTFLIFQSILPFGLCFSCFLHFFVFFIAANFAAFIMFLLLLLLFTENKTAFQVNHLQSKYMVHVKCHDLFL